MKLIGTATTFNPTGSCFLNNISIPTKTSFPPSKGLLSFNEPCVFFRGYSSVIISPTTLFVDFPSKNFSIPCFQLFEFDSHFELLFYKSKYLCT